MGLFTRKEFKDSPVVEERPKPNLTETAWSTDSFFGTRGGKFESWDPDQLKAKKGADVYRKMLRDPQVKAAFNLLIDIIISRKFRFEKPDDSEQQKQIEDFFYYNINTSIRGTWSQALRAILMSKAYGYSISEKVYFVDKYEGADRWMIAAIKGKPYETFTFKQDVYGNIKGLEQDIGGSRKKLDPKKFIIHINFPELDPVWGESDLRSAYRPYWEKDNILKFWNIFCEKLAGGFLVAKPNQMAGSLSAAEQASFDNLLRRVSQGTSARIPTGWDLDVIHGPNTDIFEKTVAHRDRQIAKSLLVPNLLGFSEQGSTGSFAQSKTQLDTFMRIVSSQGEQLADALNEQLFRELAWWNFGVKEFPRFCFENFDDQQKREIVDAWTNAVDKGVVINTFNDEQRTRELLLYDPREEDQESLRNPETDKPESEIENENEEIQENLENSESFASSNVPSPTPNTMPAVGRINGNTSELVVGDGDQPMPISETVSVSPWMDRIDFVEVEKEFTSLENQFVDEMAVGVDQAFDEIVSSIEMIINQAPGETEDTVDKNEVDQENQLILIDNAITGSTKSQINQSVRKYLRSSYEEGRKVAKNAIDLSIDGEQLNASMKSKIKLAASSSKRLAVKMTRGKEYNWTVLDFAEGLRLDTAEKYFAAKAFEITGNLTDDMVEKAKMILLEGIKNELSFDEIIEQLNDVLPGIVGKKDPETGEPDKQERARLETIARTNITDAFNQAQLSVYNDPDLGDFVEAYQYSSIIDSRTTDFCESYNNRIFLKDDPIWNSITPPNHFNCRSTVVPVTVLDEYEPSIKARKQDGALIQPGNGFGTVKG